LLLPYIKKKMRQEN